MIIMLRGDILLLKCGIQDTLKSLQYGHDKPHRSCGIGQVTRKNGRIIGSDAGWSSLAARRAHNPKVVGSNPAPATKYNWSIA